MDKFIKFFVTIVSVLFTNLSPDFREYAQEFIRNLYRKAKETASPFDDLAVKFLASVFDVELPE